MHTKKGSGTGRIGVRTVTGALVLLLGLAAACRDESPPTPPVMRFDVDPDRLEPPVSATDLGLRFQPPLGWKALSAAALDSIARALALPEAAVDVQPRYVFLQPENGSLCSVATIGWADEDSFEARVARYGILLADRFPDDSLRQGVFQKDGIRITQFLVQPGGRVVFKLIFESPVGEMIQFDYIVPGTVYPREVKAIESSIGSIRLIE